MTMWKPTAIVVATALLLLSAGPLRAGDPPALERRYLVQLDEAATAVDEPRTVAADLAQTYSGRLDVSSAGGIRGFAISMDAEHARLLAADPRVKAVRETAAPRSEPAPSASAARRIKAAEVVPLPPITVGPYKYDGAGNIIHMGTDRYTYDEMSRIISGTAVTAQNSDTEQFAYDGFGNLKKVTIPNKSIVYLDHDPLTNKLADTFGPETGATVLHIWSGGYDAAGNQLATSGTPSYSYDSMNMLSDLNTSRHEIYLYDADDERVATVTYTDTQNSVWRYTMRDHDSHVIRTVTDTILNGAHSWQQTEDYVYRTGGLLAAITPLGSSEARKHFHLDHLGSAELITDDNGQRLAVHKYWPFGGDAPGSDVDAEHMKFTGHERDLSGVDTNGLDYMHARYYNFTSGRFLTVDPMLSFDRAVYSPQMWNRYAYAMDNPIIFTDPNGTTVYLVTYTKGNSEGDDEFRRAAQTRAAQIQRQKGYDPKHDTVIVAGVQTKADFAAAVKQANGMFKQFGKVGEVDLYSHSGRGAGPVFHDAAGSPTQFSGQELRGIQVNWASGGCARFFGCNSGMNFSQAFATAQHVDAYGQPRYAYFSGSPAERIPVAPSGPVYLISAPGFHNPGPIGVGWFAYAAGDAYADPMVKSHP